MDDHNGGCFTTIITNIFFMIVFLAFMGWLFDFF